MNKWLWIWPENNLACYSSRSSSTPCYIGDGFDSVHISGGNSDQRANPFLYPKDFCYYDRLGAFRPLGDEDDDGVY